MKPLFFISCPIDTYSGYGARSRDLVKAIIELDKYDVKILPQMWGNTPWGFIEDNPEWSFLIPHLWSQPQLPKQPEIWMQITIPSEFQPIGKYNIGYSFCSNLCCIYTSLSFIVVNCLVLRIFTKTIHATVITKQTEI